MRQILLAILLSVPIYISAQNIITPARLKVNNKAKYVHITDPWNDIDEEYFFGKDGKIKTSVNIQHTIFNKDDIYKFEYIYSDDILIQEMHYYDGELTFLVNYIYADHKIILEKWLGVKDSSMSHIRAYCYNDDQLETKIKSHSNDDEYEVEEISYDDKNHLTETKTYYDFELDKVKRHYKDEKYEIIEKYVVENGKMKLSHVDYFLFDNNSNITEVGYYGYNDHEYSIDKYEYKNSILYKITYSSRWEDVVQYFDENENIIKEVRRYEETTYFKNKYNRYGDLVKVVRVKDGKVIGKKKIKIKYWK